MSGRVVAVVVAHDRQELLRRCLDALADQTRPVDRVVVVDNASTDASAELARAHSVGADVVALGRNTGGAGGFAAGIARAVGTHRAGHVWIMDDDTVPRPGALAALLAARDRYPGRPALLCSRAVWSDGRDHPMNTPRRRPGLRRALHARAEAAGAVQVRSASFVSCLVEASAIRAHGLPQAAYFIWNDDFEFTARLLRRRTGLYVPGSVVDHLSRTFGAADADPGDRFYFEVRNKLWTFLRSDAFGAAGTALYGASSVRRWARTLARSAQRGRLLRVGVRGLGDGLLRAPRPTAAELADLPVAGEVRALEVAAGRA